jgi:hypothetical protein
MARRSSRQNSSYLRHLIQRSLEDCSGFGVRVQVKGKISPIPERLWHDNYRFWLESTDLPAGRTERPYILRLLQRRHDWQAGPEPRDRLLREAETLQVLNRVDFPHPTPGFICFVKDDEAELVGMIETVVPGVSLDDFRDRTSSRENAMVGVVDWEMAQVGDPAYDLAIVSRGNWKVLGVKEGLRVLLGEYLKSGGKPISLTNVQVHELLMVLNWLEESWREYQKPSPSGQGPDFYETQLRSLYRRVASRIAR